jgi:hypothetical protein
MAVETSIGQPRLAIQRRSGWPPQHCLGDVEVELGVDVDRLLCGNDESVERVC